MPGGAQVPVLHVGSSLLSHQCYRALKIRLLFCMQPEPHPARRRNPLQHRQRMPRTLRVFEPCNH